jgi:hypothetical protein
MGAYRVETCPEGAGLWEFLCQVPSETTPNWAREAQMPLASTPVDGNGKRRDLRVVPLALEGPSAPGF